ncbi:Crp/Fnr family transcriptional regulator [Paenibacillus arenilitoris]|uniref:Cyclic nucleotide-binding domain-containing protein n=1 Tax=Paenibacillus arenilitoris TaxID=2772299 RepID=A0A927CMB7_9BACL|nr:cyclic nucleotide-binding domain-containing protein [Paenibacillus arenilitoris]MBD2869213.1 cyclic nucleotide-binding domain-containing protein [Paenibacillus arenilitoris]
MQRDERVTAYAARHRLDAIFSEAEIDRMQLHTYARGETVCSAGERLDRLYLLVRGKIKVYTTLPNGKSVLLRFNEPLAVIGDVELLTGYPVQCMVESVGESVFLVVKQEDLRETALKSPHFLTFIIRLLSHKLYTASNASSLNLLYPVENRFASYLISISPPETGASAQAELKTGKLTEVAEMLGTSYRHLNRVIARLAKDGIVERKRGAVLILDPVRLQELASGNLYS